MQLSLSNDNGSPGMRFSSIAHSPKSINLQRSEQNGLETCSGVQGTEHPQLGHFTISVLLGAVIRRGSKLVKKECRQDFVPGVCCRKKAP